MAISSPLIPVIPMLLILSLFYLEPVFDLLRMHWVASMTRKVKGFFESKRSLEAQNRWIDAMKDTTLQHYEAMQAKACIKQQALDLLCTEEHKDLVASVLAGQGESLIWNNKELWNVGQEQHELRIRKPKGARVREYQMTVCRRQRFLEENPVKFMSQPERHVNPTHDFRNTTAGRRGFLPTGGAFVLVANGMDGLREPLDGLRGSRLKAHHTFDFAILVKATLLAGGASRRPLLTQ
ncbi:predicted protein [Uncinocarpus reesii 1704]|uniref:Uncharacterized protein n=1 Tax=Uncinocarpus reesii (strain UAMH 1704) TaxID=336963 RepID=C4JS05_UNCRE|nr:uncharacterized protein UREG_05244 [Uncinocarpus reesii 1704]EEP80402.1 predicted protein [Uncinocarpus reesii 1704]